MIIWFVVGNTYNQFYEIFNDFINKSSPKLIKQTSKNQISTEEILRQTKDINIIMDQMDKEHQKYVEEELKKLTVIKFIKYFYLKSIG